MPKTKEQKQRDALARRQQEMRTFHKRTDTRLREINTLRKALGYPMIFCAAQNIESIVEYPGRTVVRHHEPSGALTTTELPYHLAEVINGTN